MAKIVKDTRQTIDVNAELENIKNENKKRKTTKERKKEKATNKSKIKVGSKKKVLSGVRSEMTKVKWPSKKDMVKYSFATIAFVIFFALFFYCIDLLLALLKEAF